MNLSPVTFWYSRRLHARLPVVLACLVLSLLFASSGAGSLRAQAEPTRVTSAAVECVVVAGEAASEATLALAWRGEATRTRLMLSLAGVDAAHTITLNGQAIAQVPLLDPMIAPDAAAGDDAPCATGETFYFDVPLAALVNGDNRLALSSDALAGDAWSATNVRLEVSGSIADASVQAAAAGATPSTITFTNGYDRTTQEARAQVPRSYAPGTPAPLILVSHARSTDMFWGEDLGLAAEADARGWLYASPQLHGSWPGDSRHGIPNPPGKYAYASLEAQHDLIGTLEYMLQHYNVDPQRIYLYGGSMGGQLAMVMGGKHPDLFAAVFENKGPSDWPAWYDETQRLQRDGYKQAFHFQWMERECFEQINGTPTRRNPSQNSFCFARRSGISYASNLRHTPLKLTHSEADLLVPASHAHNMRSALQAAGHSAPLAFEMDTVVGPNCNDGNSSVPSPFYHCFENEASDVFNFFAPHALNNNPDFVDLRTDESKAFYWLKVEQLGGERWSDVQVAVNRGQRSLAVDVVDAQPLRLGFNLGAASITEVIAQPGLGFPPATYLMQEQNQPPLLTDYSGGYLNVSPASTGQTSFTLAALELRVSANPAAKPAGQPLVSTISVAAVDTLGNPVPNGTTVVLSTSAGRWANGQSSLTTTVNGGALSESLTLDAADAEAQVQITLGNSRGAVTVGPNGSTNPPTPTATLAPTDAPTNAPTATPVAPTNTPAPTATPGGGGTLLVQEAEAGNVYGRNMRVGSDAAASGGAFIHWPDGSGDRLGKPGRWNSIDFTFNVPAAGDYNIVGWTLAAQQSDASFWVQIDDAPASGYLWDLPVGGGYQQTYVVDRGYPEPVQATLGAGPHVVTVFLREDGARLDKIALEAVGGGSAPAATATPTVPVGSTPAPTATPMPTATPTSPTGGSVLLVQEAEAGDGYGKNIQVDSDAVASGGAFIHWPNGVGNRTGKLGAWNRIEYTFDVTEAGRYRIKGWTLAAQDGDDSFWIAINDLPTNGYLWDIPIGAGYQENYAIDRGSPTPVEATLSAGQHVVTLYLREDGARLDKIALELANVAAAALPVDPSRATAIEGVVVVDQANEANALPRFPAGVQITLADAATQGDLFLATAQTDVEGRYYFDGVPAGEYVVTLAPPVGYDTAEPSVAVEVGSRGTATAHFDLLPAQTLPARTYLPLVGR